MKRLLLGGAAAVALLLAGAPAAHADDLTCAGTLTGPINANVIVPNDSSCELAGAIVNGNVITARESRLDVSESTIVGNVECGSGPPTPEGQAPFECNIVPGGLVQGDAIVLPGGMMGVRGGEVLGNFQGREDAQLFLGPELTEDGDPVPGTRGQLGGDFQCDACLFGDAGRASIGGDVQFKNLDEGSFVFDETEIAGDVQVVESSGGAFLFVLSTSTIGGNVRYEKNDGTIDIIDNRIAGNLELFENRGGAFDVSRNTVGEKLTCKENVPPPVGGGNVAREKEGQCAAL